MTPVLALCSIWTVLRLKERMVKLFMEHSARQHMAVAGSSATQACSIMDPDQSVSAQATLRECATVAGGCTKDADRHPLDI